MSESKPCNKCGAPERATGSTYCRPCNNQKAKDLRNAAKIAELENHNPVLTYFLSAKSWRIGL